MVAIQYPLEKFKYIPKEKIFIHPLGNTIHYTDGPIEQYIMSALKNSKDLRDGSKELVKWIKDWPTYYHLGIGRSNILRALELRNTKTLTVLELGAGIGAITRYLGENFKRVDAIEGAINRAKLARERTRDLENVNIYASNFMGIKFDPKYDIATLIGVLEYAPIYVPDQTPEHSVLTVLNHVKSALKKEGLLVIAIENKIGLKYWIGYPEDHTGRVFDGINDYPYYNNPTRHPITFSKAELTKLLKKAGFNYIHFFYCFPDYKFAETIINDSDEIYKHDIYNWINTPFPQSDWNNKLKLINKILNKLGHKINENFALKTLTKARLLGEFANSFLIVASMDSTPIYLKQDWIIKKFSIKRRRELQTISTLRKTRQEEYYIEKTRMYLQEKEIKIKENNITLVHKVGRFGYHFGTPLLEEIKAAGVAGDINKITDILKKLHSALIKLHGLPEKDSDGYQLVTGNAFDFIPRNLIQTPTNNLIAVDYEFTIEHPLPNDYILFRAIIVDVLPNINMTKQCKLKLPVIEGGMIKHKKTKLGIKILKNIYGTYSKERYREHAKLETKIQKIISGG